MPIRLCMLSVLSPFFLLTAFFLYDRGIGKGLPMPLNQIFNLDDIEKRPS